MTDEYQPVRFSLDEAQVAADGWFNCGPGALCAVANLRPEEALPHLRGFERKHYTNPAMMQGALASLGIPFERIYECLGIGKARNPVFPCFGLVRVQWSGPWTAPGVPVRARYRHTHWVAWDSDNRLVFDVNAMCVGGWISEAEWRDEMVPWLLRHIDPKADSEWWPTHCWEIKRGVSTVSLCH